jgi:signal recognition particle subunit SRP68
VEYPPKLHPVPVKPYFFDIAYNYIGLDDVKPQKVEPVVQKTEEKKQEPPVKKGWFWR